MARPTKPKIVSFQLEESYLKRLEKEAAYFKVSGGQYARRLVIDALDDTATERLEKRMAMLETEMVQLQQSLALAVQAILVTAGNMPLEDAKDWTERNISPKN